MSRTIVVTGGGTGIGRAVAAHFAADGEDVVITGRRVELLAATASDLGVRHVAGDASDPEDLAALADAVPDVDVLVTCAGGNTDFDRTEPRTLTDRAEAFRANLEANLLGPVLTTAALHDGLRAGGAVVHIGSIAADKGADSYGAAKAGLAAWNLSQAAELGRLEVTSNVVAPGYVSDTEFFRDRLTTARRDSLVEASLTGRASRPEDVAAVVAFLASPGARQITGQVVAVNGGERTTR